MTIDESQSLINQGNILTKEVIETAKKELLTGRNPL